MRLDKGTAPERRHPHATGDVPYGSQGSMALHVINGTTEDIKAHRGESIDAFFEIYGKPQESRPGGGDQASRLGSATSGGSGYNC